MRRADLVSFFFLFSLNSLNKLVYRLTQLVVLTSQRKQGHKFLRESLGTGTSLTAFNIKNHF